MYDLLRRDQDVFMAGALHPVYMQQQFQALLQQFLLMLRWVAGPSLADGGTGTRPVDGGARERAGNRA